MKIKAILISLVLVAASSAVITLGHEIEPDPNLKAGFSTIIGVNHVGLSVEDLKRSVAFYKKSAGLNVVYPSIRDIDKSLHATKLLDDASGRMSILKGPNGFLRIIEFEKKIPARSRKKLEAYGPGRTHICYIAPKARPIDGRFVKSGATWESMGKAMVDMRGVGYMYGYLRDLDGLMFEIEHAPEPNFEGHMWLGHIATATPDLTRTLEFYTKVLGYDYYRRADDLSGSTYDDVVGFEGVGLHGGWFRVAPYYSLEFWQFTNPVTKPRTELPRLNEIGYNLVALETTDIDADFNRLKSLGLALETEIVDTQDGRAFYFRDPDGNLLALMEFRSGSKLSLQAFNSN